MNESENAGTEDAQTKDTIVTVQNALDELRAGNSVELTEELANALGMIQRRASHGRYDLIEAQFRSDNTQSGPSEAVYQLDSGAYVYVKNGYVQDIGDISLNVCEVDVTDVTNEIRNNRYLNGINNITQVATGAAQAYNDASEWFADVALDEPSTMQYGNVLIRTMDTFLFDLEDYVDLPHEEDYNELRGVVKDVSPVSDDPVAEWAAEVEFETAESSMDVIGIDVAQEARALAKGVHSPQEARVTALLMAGFSRTEIAETLSLSESSVRTYRARAKKEIRKAQRTLDEVSLDDI